MKSCLCFRDVSAWGWLPGINTDVKTPTLMLAYSWDAQPTLLESYTRRIYVSKHSFRHPLIPSSSTLSVFSGQEMHPSPLCNMTPGSEDGGKNTTEWGKYTTCGAENSQTHFWSDKIKPTAFPTCIFVWNMSKFITVCGTPLLYQTYCHSCGSNMHTCHHFRALP